MVSDNTSNFFLTLRKTNLTFFSANLAVRIAFILLGFFLTPTARSQTNDWQTVIRLKPRTAILVKTDHRYPCILLSANERELQCDVPHHWRLDLL